MKRTVAIILFPLLLSACAVPSALTLAGYAVESASYMKTGKTVSDHAVSAVAGRDCQLLHGVTKGKVCKDQKRSGKALAKTRVAGVRAVNRAENRNKTGGKSKHVRPPAEKWVVVVGTYPDLLVAKKSAAAEAPQKTQIVTAVVDGEVVYRVTSLPFGSADAENKKGTFVRSETPHVSLVPVCPEWMQDDKCIVIY